MAGGEPPVHDDAVELPGLEHLGDGGTELAADQLFVATYAIIMLAKHF